MPRLIHLNGPPGIGKSTIAQRYVDERPGVLNLDIDQVRTLIGGWRERFAETGEIVRPVALSMAATHLRGGRDVVIPQFLGRLSEVERFEAVARDNGAVFCAVVLMDDKQRCIERFNRRGEGGENSWHRQVQQIVGVLGGQAFLADMYDQLIAVVEARPDATVVLSVAGAIQQTYEALTELIDSSPACG